MFVPKWRNPPENEESEASGHLSGSPVPEAALLEMTGPMSSQSVRILLVDSESEARNAAADALRGEGYEVCEAGNGQEARTLLCQSSFDALLTEIVLPDGHGLTLLKEALEQYPQMPVVFVTAQASVEMARLSLTQGASDFVLRPADITELALIVERNLTRQVLQRKALLRNKLALQTSNESILDALLSALSTRDTETQGHSERVTAYTMEMADRLQLSAKELYHIERGALLHDIGKIGVPDRILLKPDKLTPEEWVEMKKHPVIGYQMCARIEMLQGASQIVLHHHEAWDGSGYPHGLQGEAIPLGARIFALADTLDAMTSDRPYRAALSFETARTEIEKFAGRQFDTDLVRLFLEIPAPRLIQIRALAGK